MIVDRSNGDCDTFYKGINTYKGTMHIGHGNACREVLTNSNSNTPGIISAIIKEPMMVG